MEPETWQEDKFVLEYGNQHIKGIRTLNEICNRESKVGFHVQPAAESQSIKYDKDKQ